MTDHYEIMKKLTKRKKNRLQNYDYSQSGYYYITICTKHFIEYFGKIENELMILNDLGKIVEDRCSEIPDHYENVEIDEFKVMPNHLHMIVVIKEKEADKRAVNKISISTIINSLKGILSKEIRKNYDQTFQWQRSFYDHIVRNYESLNIIRKYIKFNELKWLYESKIPRN